MVRKRILYIVLGIFAFAVLLPIALIIQYEVSQMIAARTNPADITCKLVAGPTKSNNVTVAFLVRNVSDKAIDQIGVLAYTTPEGAGNDLTFGPLAAHSSYSRLDDIYAGFNGGIIVAANCRDTWATFADGKRWTEPYHGPWLP